MIPVLGPYEARCFSRYFKEVDRLLSRRFILKFLPDEEHLTSVLCELLDDRGGELHSLAYTLADLNRDLSRKNGLLKADIRITAAAYDKYQERHETQADLGIVVQYHDYIEHENNFERGVLVQAKKLFPDRYGNYNFSSQYESFNSDQHNRLASLNGLYVNRDCGYECVKYLMYNPPLDSIPRYEQKVVIHSQLKREANQIFDYIYGLHRYRELAEPEEDSLLSLGSLFVSVGTVHELAEAAARASRTKQPLYRFGLGELVHEIDLYRSSLPWFIVFELMCNGAGCSCSDFLQLVRSGKKQSMEDDLVVAPPRFSIEIRITAGEEGNESAR